METNASVLPSAKTACIAITIIFSGFLAFAYGFGIYLFPVLSPDMRQDLAFTYAEMGYVAAGIQAGFILSSVQITTQDAGVKLSSRNWNES